MGIVLKFNCPKCAYEAQVNVGRGFLDSNLTVIKDRFKNNDEVNEWLQTNEVKNFYTRRTLSYCKTCKKLYSTPTLKLTNEQDHTKKFKNACANCGDSLKLLDEKSKSIACPECSAVLVKQEFDLWK